MNILILKSIVDFRQLIRNEATARLLAGLLVSIFIHLMLIACNCFRFGVATGANFSITPTLNVTLPLSSGGELPAVGEGESRHIIPSPSVQVQDTPPLPSSVAPIDGAHPLVGPEADIFPLPSALYLSAKSLSVKPTPISKIDLDAPEFDGYLIPGRLTARLYISETGSVDSIVVDQSNLPPIFSGKVINTFSQARFAPGEINGKAVKSQIRIEVDFDPELK